MRVRTTAALILVVSLLLAACGGSNEATTPASTEPPSSTAPGSTAPPGTAGTTVPIRRTATVVAHRGASAYAPEHTFAAYDLALEQGADYLEQDLQLTADGELVVLHDEALDRTARGPAESCTGLVREKTLEQLRACDVGSWFNEAHPELADPTFVGQPIPTMREVFERYGPDVRYYIETKAPDAQPGMEQALLDLMAEVGMLDRAASDRQVIIQSFSPDSLELVHAQQPDLALVLLVRFNGGPIDPAVLDGASAYAAGIGPNAADVDAAVVAAAHERCLVIHPYTVDDPAQMATLLAAGVDGMFTNAPDVLLEQRDASPPPPDHCG